MNFMILPRTTNSPCFQRRLPRCSCCARRGSRRKRGVLRWISAIEASECAVHWIRGHTFYSFAHIGRKRLMAEDLVTRSISIAGLHHSSLLNMPKTGTSSLREKITLQRYADIASKLAAPAIKKPPCNPQLFMCHFPMQFSKPQLQIQNAHDTSNPCIQNIQSFLPPLLIPRISPLKQRPMIPIPAILIQCRIPTLHRTFLPNALLSIQKELHKNRSIQKQCPQTPR